MIRQRTQKFLLTALVLFLGCGSAFAFPESTYYDPTLFENDYYVLYGKPITLDGTETISTVRRDVNPISGEEFVSFGYVHLNEDLNVSLTLRYDKTKNRAKMILSGGKKYSKFPDNTVNVVYQFDSNTIVDTKGKILEGASRYIELPLSDERLDSMINLMEKSAKFMFRIDGEEFTLDIAGLNHASNSIVGGRASDDFKYLIGKIDAETLQENRRINAEMTEDEWKEFLLAIQEDDFVIQFGGKRHLNVYANRKIFESKPRVN